MVNTFHPPPGMPVRSLLSLALRIVSGAVLAFTLGCASTPSSSPAPGVPTTRPDTAAIGVPQQPGTTALPAFSYRDGIYGYDLEQHTVIAVGAEGAVPMEDTLMTRGSLIWSVRTSNDTVIIAGTMDSLAVASTRDTLAPPRRLTTPLMIDIRPGLEPAPLPADTTVAPNCDSMEDAARSIARDAYIHVPAGAQRGQRWSDSSSRSICRGGIPLTATTVSTFEVQDIRSRGDSTIGQVVRRSTLTINGTGMQGSRRIGVTGTGTSETLFSHDLRAGAFIESTGQSTLDLRFETVQQTERVTQRSTSRVRLRPSTP